MKTVFFALISLLSVQTIFAASAREEARFLAAVKVAFEKHDADALMALTCWDRVAENGKADDKQQYAWYVAERATEMVLVDPDLKSPGLEGQEKEGAEYRLNLPLLKQLKLKFGPGGQMDEGTFPVGEKDGKLYLLEPALVEGVIVTGTMKQIIGTFSTYGMVKVGDSFELNLSDLPKQKIEFIRPHFDAKKDVPPYAPFSPALIVEKVTHGKKRSGANLIRLSSTGTNGVRARFVVQVSADELQKGSQVWIMFYEEAFGNINCMAEAEGVLK